MTRKSSAVEQFPGTPIDGPDVEKDGGFGMPSSATSGINNYDQEGARVKKPKKSKSKPRVEKDEDECSMDKDESPNAPYDDFDDKDDVASKSATVDIAKFEQPALEAFYKRHKEFFDSEAMVKGVCDVASLGNLIAQLNFMADSQAMERQIEGDSSKIPEALRTEAAKLLKILSDMASEESEEISDGKTAEDVMRSTQPTMTPGLYRADVSTFAKSLRDSLGFQKVGRRNSAKDLETIQKVHDAACELGADCGQSFNGDVSKHEDSDMRKTDTIMAEGNKRGAAVSDPSMEPQSTNAADAEDTSDQGQEKPNNDTKKSKKRMDEDMARKGKKRADMMDEDDDDWDDSDDSDDDDDDIGGGDKLKPKAKKAKKSVTLDEESLAKVVASAVVAAMATLSKSTGSQELDKVNIRNAPHLMAVGKGGDAAAHVEVNLEDLKKSVSAHPRDIAGPQTQVDQHGIKTGDYGTATLIKAIHAGGTRFMLKPSDIPSPVQ